MSDSPLPDLTQQPLDIQHDPDPAHEVPPARRIPHLGHALLYFSMSAFAIFLAMALALTFVHAYSAETAMQHPFAAALGQVAGYVLTFLIAVPLFPLLWQYSFVQGIHLNLRAMRLNWWKLVLLGAGASALAQLVLQYVKQPEQNDILKLFATQTSAWITVLLVVIVAPIAEEVAFRGFLLPSLATAYDWLTMERTPAAVDRWTQTTAHSNMAWVFATVFSSLAFAALHGPEYSWSVGSLAVLFVASVVFSLVRIRLRSVAAAVIVHMAYDGLVLLEMIVVTGGFRHLDKLH
jgi:membrane protease YdiL (CAAX protease family)